MNYFDIDVFKIAKIVGIEKVIIPELVDVLNSDASDSIIAVLEILAVYKSQSLKQAAEKYYKKNIEEIKNKYKVINVSCNNVKKMAEWVKSNIESSLNTISGYSVEQIESSIKEWVNDNLPKSNTIQKLYEIGLISYEDIELEGHSAEKLDEINNKYQLNLISEFSKYVQEVKDKKKAYEDAYAVFNIGENERKEMISNKRKELKQQGIFALSKKKEIKLEIDRLEKEYEEYRNTEPVDVKNAYFNM